ncbi:hypothetical protein [Marinomonas gallaica]|uniref:hypothetical protein n=1 Tax=Marinomonas gallaica TaxID=1806667 RepID=UPI003A90F78E
MQRIRTYTVFLKDRKETISSVQLAEFKDLYIGNRDFGKRISELFVLDLYIHELEFGIFPSEITDEIRHLETGNYNSFTKPPTQFRREPLKGLWHKHYFSAYFVVQNLENSWGKSGLNGVLEEVFNALSSGATGKDFASTLVNEHFEKSLETRSENKKVTGEWIVYAEYQGKNYYLCMGIHNADDQSIYNRIVDNCLREFPFLKSIQPFSKST